MKCNNKATEKSCKLHAGSGGNPEQLNAAPWLKASSLTVALGLFLIVFGTRSHVPFEPSKALLHGLLTSVAAIPGLERPLAHFSMVRMSWISCQMTQVIAWQLCAYHESACVGGLQRRAFYWTVWAERLFVFQVIGPIGSRAAVSVHTCSRLAQFNSTSHFWRKPT